ncbi:basic leucine zipper 6 [Phoenix dactylifera]|uniref:Basic leucine zipper 6 n=1 Tax=Phoenix dactylifera TaxID=42345 RepID=A0A8B7CI36_PHODC|nr:basic leucine zipper 6 [Phoenix dactylifera]XP_008799707.1 basic leucine zipper 6 [Phoenix dactylifera]
MSRPAHLPPRCPFQNRGLLPRALDSTPQTTLYRFPSQGSIIDEKLSWLDDLLTDSESSPRGISHRRSSSDSAAVLDVLTTLGGPVSPVDEGNASSVCALHKPSESTDEDESNSGLEAGSGFEASCVYGPNSPRQKSKLTSSESSMVTALLENVPWNPLQYVTVDFHSGSNSSESNVSGDVLAATGDHDPEKAARRRSGQRSRVRKLQYIAELERTVDALQTLGAELAARVASMYQQHFALSIENKKLRRQITILRQEKMMRDGQYQSLKSEAERLKMIYGCQRSLRSAASCFEMGFSNAADISGDSWPMLDIGKLSLGGSPVPTRHGLGR